MRATAFGGGAVPRVCTWDSVFLIAGFGEKDKILAMATAEVKSKTRVESPEDS